jgi:hypothetical protein
MLGEGPKAREAYPSPDSDAAACSPVVRVLAVDVHKAAHCRRTNRKHEIESKRPTKLETKYSRCEQSDPVRSPMHSQSPLSPHLPFSAPPQLLGHSTAKHRSEIGALRHPEVGRITARNVEKQTCATALRERSLLEVAVDDQRVFLTGCEQNQHNDVKRGGNICSISPWLMACART